MRAKLLVTADNADTEQQRTDNPLGRGFPDDGGFATGTRSRVEFAQTSGFTKHL